MNAETSYTLQLCSWDVLESNINHLVINTNFLNIKETLQKLFSQNLLRGRGLFCNKILETSVSSPKSIPSLVALVAFINSKFDDIGLLLLKRLVLNLQTAYTHNSNHELLCLAKLLAHLINQRVVHDFMAAQFLKFLLEDPKEGNMEIEIAVYFLLDCGNTLGRYSPIILKIFFKCFQNIIETENVGIKNKYLIQGLFSIRENNFKEFIEINQDLDFLDRDCQCTHDIRFVQRFDPETWLDVFRFEPDFMENEKRYSELKRILLLELKSKQESSCCCEVGDNFEELERNEKRMPYHPYKIASQDRPHFVKKEIKPLRYACSGAFPKQAEPYHPSMTVRQHQYRPQFVKKEIKPLQFDYSKVSFLS